MLLELRIKLRSPWLAEQRTREGRKFIYEYVDKPGEEGEKAGESEEDRRKRKEKRVVLKVASWMYAFRAACGDLHMDDVDPTTVRLPMSIKSPAIVEYHRRWQDRRRPGEQQQEKFQAFQEGAVLTIPVQILPRQQEIAAPKRPPTRDELHRMMVYIGEQTGLSEWGSQFNYGRFVVLSLEPQ